jgi:arginyl-tRNA--protein-N-Asp/Glu arginylyltransferase
MIYESGKMVDEIKRRAKHLKEHPICERCRKEVAVTVHHVDEAEGTRLRSLCVRCNLELG